MIKDPLRSEKKGEDLTHSEQVFIYNSMEGDKGPNCPDCGGILRTGPKVGLCINFLCDNCEAGFNLGLKVEGGKFFPAQRIKDRKYKFISSEVSIRT